jgi:hypothetical protein
MATSYTTFLGLALPVTGELSGTWGDTVNNYISNYIDAAVAGAQTITTDTTLTKTTGSSLGSTSSQYAIIIASPASANITITAPAASKIYTIINTSATYTVKIVGAGPTTGVTLGVSEKAQVAWNGSDFVRIGASGGAGVFSSITNTGLTSGRVVYSTTNGLETDSANLTFNGTTLTANTLNLTNALGTTYGGTGLTSFTANGVVYASSSSALATGSALTWNGITFVVNSSAGAGINIGYSNTSFNYYDANTQIWRDGSFNEGMRLTSTGLGIGTSSPSAKLESLQTTSGAGGWYMAGQFSSATATMVRLASTTGNKYISIGNDSDGGFHLFVNGSAGAVGTEAAILNSSGNLGLGVTPSVWGSAPKAIEIGGNSAAAAYLAFNSSATSQGYCYWNMYYNGSGNIVKTTGTYPAFFGLNASGQFVWGVSSSTQTAGAAASTSQAMTLDANGNLGIGTTSPTGILTVRKDSTTAQPFIDIVNRSVSSTFVHGGIRFSAYRDVSDPSYPAAIWAVIDAPLGNVGNLAFGTSINGNSSLPTERMRLDSSGNLLVGTSAKIYDGKISVSFASTGEQGIAFIDTTAANNGIYAYFINSSGNVAGSIARSGATTILYNVTSDARAKQNIQDSDNSSSLIDALKVRQFDWKEDGNHQRYGFIAQELVTVAPEAVYQPADPEEMMAVDYSKLVPMLVKEIQSLRIRISQLEAK